MVPVNYALNQLWLWKVEKSLKDLVEGSLILWLHRVEMSNKPYILRGRESFCFEYKPKISNMEILRDGTHTKKSIVSHRATYTSSIPDEETSRPRVYVDVTPSMYGTLHTQWYTMMCVARETKSTSVLPEVVTWWQSICSFLDSCFQSRKKVFTVRGGPKQCILFLLFLGEEGVSQFFAVPTKFTAKAATASWKRWRTSFTPKA